MAWNTTNEGIPYYKGVAPEVPVADNTAAKIISAGTPSLVEGFTRMAIARENARIEQEDNLRKADLAAQTLKLKSQDQYSDYELKKQYYTALQTNADANLTRAKKGIAQFTQATDFKNALQDSIVDNDSRAFKAAGDLKLNDDTYRVDHPVEWLSNLNEWKNRFGNASLGAVPGQMKEFDSMADNIKVPFLHGATYDKDPVTGKYQWTASDAKPQDVPLRQIVEQYQNPDLRPSIENGLIAAGHGKIVDTIKTTPKKFGLFGGSEETVHTPTLDAYGNKILSAAGNVNLSRGQNEVPEALTGKGMSEKLRAGIANDPGTTSTPSGQLTDPAAIDQARQRMDTENSIPVEPAPLPDTSSSGPAAATPTFEPTKTDQTLSQARAVVAANPQARGQVLQRLQGMGINPSLLDAA